MSHVGILEKWQLSYEEVDELVTENPSLRGMVLGYAAEVKVRHLWLQDERLTNLRRPDPHDRTEHGDYIFEYRGVELSLEVKSLQTKTVRATREGLEARFQCDASDRRTVKLPSGTTIETTCLLVGEFDLLAVNLFAFEDGLRPTL